MKWCLNFFKRHETYWLRNENMNFKAFVVQNESNPYNGPYRNRDTTNYFQLINFILKQIWAVTT